MHTTDVDLVAFDQLAPTGGQIGFVLATDQGVRGVMDAVAVKKEARQLVTPGQQRLAKRRARRAEGAWGGERTTMANFMDCKKARRSGLLGYARNQSLLLANPKICSKLMKHICRSRRTG